MFAISETVIESPLDRYALRLSSAQCSLLMALVLAKNIHQQRDGCYYANRHERPSNSTTLVFAQLARQQQADSRTQHPASTCDQRDIR
jgi:hypothetical protein